MKEKDKINEEEGVIIYGDYEKVITFPKEYEDFINNIISLFHIPEDKKPLLIITYKNIYGDSIKILSREDYSDFLLKLSGDEIQNIIFVSIQETIKNKIKSYREDIYDKDEDDDDNDKEKENELNNKDDDDDSFLRKGHVFEKKQNNPKSEIFGGGGLDINKILNENLENDENNINNINNDNNKIDNIFNNDIAKSVLPPLTNFPSYCNICQKFPIVKIMYFCIDCHLNLCEDCEKNLGYNHRHCYYKIRNKEQYQEMLKMEVKDKESNNNINDKNINKKTRIDKLKDKKEGFNGIFNSIIGFMSGGNNNQ